MSKREQILVGVNFGAIHILGIVMPDILTVWEIPLLIVFAGVYAAVLLRGERTVDQPSKEKRLGDKGV